MKARRPRKTARRSKSTVAQRAESRKSPASSNNRPTAMRIRRLNHMTPDFLALICQEAGLEAAFSAITRGCTYVDGICCQMGHPLANGQRVILKARYMLDQDILLYYVACNGSQPDDHLIERNLNTWGLVEDA